MKISLSPWRSDTMPALSVSKAGDTLTINGELFDFSRLADGDTLPLDAITSQWFDGSVNRVASEIELTLRLTLPANFSPAQAFPVPLLNVRDGDVVLPQPLAQPESATDGVDIKDNQE